MAFDCAVRTVDQNLSELYFAVSALIMSLYADLFPIFSGGTAQTWTD